MRSATQTQPIDPDIAALARVKFTVWATLITCAIGIAGNFYAVQNHTERLHQLEEKKADQVSVADKLDALTKIEAQRAEAFEKRLSAIEEFQRRQAEAAMQQAARANAREDRTRGD